MNIFSNGRAQCYETLGTFKLLPVEARYNRRVPAQDGMFALILWYVAKTLY